MEASRLRRIHVDPSGNFRFLNLRILHHLSLSIHIYLELSCNISRKLSLELS
ncbi:hypothetical protein RHMOL_Rhmol07G0303500 [Rhododendron molle]|uniref:Uncharacterized protein n=1 Tax=Rhododendron molle TaxID=49168 RepID=A0ACC0N7G6_RHOML|nr:hypothetical protein RHMOL_Rhmol07G0303500 [Rhododendron molle]